MNYLLVPTHRGFWGAVAGELADRSLKLAQLVCTPAQHECVRDTMPPAPWEDLEAIMVGARRLAPTREQWSKLSERLDFAAVERQYLDMMGRFERYRPLPHHEKLSLFLLHVQTAAALLLRERIDCVVLTEAPHLPFLFVLQDVARALGLAVLQFTGNPIAPTAFVSRDGVIVPPLRASAPDWIAGIVDRWLEGVSADYATAKPGYMQSQESKDRDRRRLLRRSYLDNLKKSLGITPRTREQAIIRRHRELLNLEFDIPACTTRKRTHSPKAFARAAYDRSRGTLSAFYEGLTTPTAQLRRPYVCFPMQFQPERTTNPDGGLHYDQMRAVLDLRAGMPADWDLVLREHPSQFLMFKIGFGHRSLNWYRALAAVEGVYFSSLREDPFELTRNAREVFTITGTVALEAAARGVPAAHYGQPWYRGCPGIASLHDTMAGHDWGNGAAPLERVREFLMDRVGRYPIGPLALPIQQFFERATGYAPQQDEPAAMADLVVSALR